jgi:hypothetical protein
MNLDNQTVARVFSAYRMTDKEQRANAKKDLSAEYALNDVKVRMVGVWDTVGSLGVPGHLFGAFDQAKYGFLDTTLNPCIENAYHAISIDERRMSFQPTLWTDSAGNPRANDAQVQQVWFPGVHCDVGGSYTETQLSNITLRWMVDNAKACGLVFNEEALEACLSPKPFNPLGPAHDEWKLIPWGVPEHRSIPVDAVLANTVQLRLAKMPQYRPENLLVQPAEIYQQVTVIPVEEL